MPNDRVVTDEMLKSALKAAGWADGDLGRSKIIDIYLAMRALEPAPTDDAGRLIAGKYFEALRLILPLARAYAAAHPVGSNQEYIDYAAGLLNGATLPIPDDPLNYSQGFSDGLRDALRAVTRNRSYISWRDPAEYVVTPTERNSRSVLVDWESLDSSLEINEWWTSDPLHEGIVRWAEMPASHQDTSISANVHTGATFVVDSDGDRAQPYEPRALEPAPEVGGDAVNAACNVLFRTTGLLFNEDALARMSRAIAAADRARGRTDARAVPEQTGVPVETPRQSPASRKPHEARDLILRYLARWAVTHIHHLESGKAEFDATVREVFPE